MSSNNTAEIIADTIIPAPLMDVLRDKYLSYAMSTITARSLPDVRDGLKPVHRRLLYAMGQLQLTATSMPKKSARVVGDVIGKFHPHGDTSIYEALVRLAQDFSVRYPLIDGQGNFGNIDGDNAAAMRYTEARLTAVAEAMLQGLEENAVDFRSTYDGEGQEPVVMPSNFPNLLANGSYGIAVGMATSIPPHNVGEICAALQALIADRNTTDSVIAEHIKGPDFPTGGLLISSQSEIAEIYRTGRGSLRLRARWEKEDLRQGQYQIVVTEIPFQVQKSRLVEKIADLLGEKKLPLLEDIRDESAEDIRLILVPKNRSVDAEILMESLFKTSDLECRVSFNMNVLDSKGIPRVMPIKEICTEFLDHRHTVLVRRSEHRLSAVLRRLEVVEGYLIVYLNLDEVIRIIREEDEPKTVMMKTFGLNDTQAEAILNMRLRSLRRLEEMQLRQEQEALQAEQSGLESLLGDEGKRWKAISAEIREMDKKFGGLTELGKRRTGFGSASTMVDVPLDAFIEREPVTVVCSEKGWIRMLKGHIAADSELRFKEGDSVRFHIHTQTTDKLLLVSTMGRIFTLDVSKLPAGRGFGEPLRLMVDVDSDAKLLALFVYQAGSRLLLASKGGRGFVVEADQVIAHTRSGKQVMTTDESDPAILCHLVNPQHTHLACAANNRKLLVFELSEIPTLQKGKGVILQKYKDASTILTDAKGFNIDSGLTWQSGSRNYSVQMPELMAWIGKRASSGRLVPTGFPRSGKFGE